MVGKVTADGVNACHGDSPESARAGQAVSDSAPAPEDGDVSRSGAGCTRMSSVVMPSGERHACGGAAWPGSRPTRDYRPAGHRPKRSRRRVEQVQVVMPTTRDQPDQFLGPAGAPVVSAAPVPAVHISLPSRCAPPKRSWLPMRARTQADFAIGTEVPGSQVIDYYKSARSAATRRQIIRPAHSAPSAIDPLGMADQ